MSSFRPLLRLGQILHELRKREPCNPITALPINARSVSLSASRIHRLGFSRTSKPPWNIGNLPNLQQPSRLPNRYSGALAARKMYFSVGQFFDQLAIRGQKIKLRQRRRRAPSNLFEIQIVEFLRVHPRGKEDQL